MQALTCTHIQDIATCVPPHTHTPVGYLDPTWMSFKFYCYLQSRYWGGQYEVMNLSVFEAVKTEISTIALFHFFLYFIACSQTLYFLFKVRGAHVIKNKKQGGFIDRQRKGVGVGEEENRRSLFFVLARALLSPMFSKRTKSKKKTTSGNRLFFIRKAIWTKIHPQRSRF